MQQPLLIAGQIRAGRPLFPTLRWGHLLALLALLLGSGGAWAQTVTIGTGTGTARYPFGAFYGFERSAMIYTATEVGAAGNQVTTVAFNITTATTATLAKPLPIVIYLKDVSNTTFAATSTVATEETGATQVYAGTLPASTFTSVGWKTITLTTPFLHTSTSNLEVIVEANYGGGGASEGSTGKKFTYSAAANAFQFWQTDTSPPTTAGTRSANRPNIQLTLATATACSGTPTAGTATASPATICRTGTVALSLSGASTSTGLTYQWQSSTTNATAGFANISGATSSTYTGTALGTTYYRAVVTCSNGGASATSAAATVTNSSAVAVSYYNPATTPFSEGFEATWVDGCDTRELPPSSANWTTIPATGNSSWRRFDDGAAGTWTSAALGSYAPAGSNAAGSPTSSSSARFHNYYASSGTTGDMLLYLDLSSGPAGIVPQLTFDYIKPDGNILSVALSTDGGATFGTTLFAGSTTAQSAWTKPMAIALGTANSATTVLRFRCTGTFGSVDTGLDNVSVLFPSPLLVTGSTYAQSGTDTTPGATDQLVTRVAVTTSGSTPGVTLNSATFTLGGSANPADVASAKLYVSPTASFTGATLVPTSGAVAAPGFTLTATTPQVLTTGTNYFFLAYDLAAGATLGNTVAAVPATLTFSTGTSTPTLSGAAAARTIVGPLNGDYTVGSTLGTEAYPTLTAALNALNVLGVKTVANGGGGVRFLLTNPGASKPYNVANGETFPLIIGAVAGASATTGVTIKPYAGTAALISASSTSGTLALVTGASYITIDGSNTVGGTSQDLIIENTTATTTSTYIVGINPSGDAAPATTGNTVRNTVLRGTTPTAPESGLIVYTASGTTVRNNALSLMAYGIELIGTSTASRDQNNLVAGNTVGGTGTGSDLGQTGIYIANQSLLNVLGNTVQNITTGTSGRTGISLLTSDSVKVRNNTVRDMVGPGTTPKGIFVGGTVTNTVLNANNITNIAYTGTAGYGAYGIQVVTATANAGILLSNNTVSALNGDGFTGFGNSSVAGIYLSGAAQSGIHLYYNSVNLSGNLGGSRTSYVTAALAVESGTTGLTLTNNILANTLAPATGVTTSASTKAYAYYNANASTAYASNYNDYYVGTAAAATGKLTGYTQSTIRETLADLRTGTTQDANSLDVDPGFTSATNLHISNTALAAGTPIAGITTDFEGETRNATTPYLGADELPALNVDVQPTALVSPAATTTCYSNAEAVTVTVRNASTLAAIDFAANPVTVTVSVTGAATQAFTTTVSSNADNPGGTPLASGGTVNITLPGTLNMSAPGTYSFAVTATAVGDLNAANDVLTPAPTRTVAAPVAGTASATPGSYCGVASGTPSLSLTGTTGQGSFVWQSATSATGPFTTLAGSANQNPFVAPTITATTYYQALATCNTNTATSNVVTVTLADPTVTAISPVTRCGPGAVTLTATPGTGATVNWYDTSTSTTVLATGSTYSPTVTATRQFFAGASVPGASIETVGRPTFTTQNGTTPAGYGLAFDATDAFTLTSVVVFRNSTSGGTVTVQLQNSAGALIPGQTYSGTVPAGAVGTAFTLPLNFSVPAGTGLRLLATTGTADLVRESSGATFPYTSPSGNVSITSGYISGITTTYYYFYNWQVSGPCVGARTAVQVNVTPAPALTSDATTANTSICAGGSTTLTFGPATYPTLTVSPSAGATVSGSMVTFSPTATTAYTVTGDDGTGPAGCNASLPLTIKVSPVPNAPTLTPASAAVCLGSSTVAVAAGSANVLPNQTILATATFDSGPDGFTVASSGSTSNNTAFLVATAPYTNSYTGGPSGYNGPAGTSTGGFYVANSGYGSGVVSNTQLTSPAFSTVGYTAATLSFQQYYKYYSSDVTAKVEYSTDGLAWATLIDYRTANSSDGTATGAQTAKAIALPAAALGQATVQVRFNYTSTFGYYYAVDNVGVTGTFSEQPTFAVVGNPATAVVSGANITFSPTATTTYQVTASYPSSPGCASPATPVTITVSTSSTWNGSASTDWFDAANWTSCVPTRLIDATVPAGTPNYPALGTSATAEVRTLTLAAGSSLSQSAGALAVYGNLTNDPAATITLSGGMVSFLGATATVASPVAFFDLTTNLDTPASTVAMSGDNTVTNSLTMTQGVLSTGGTLTLAPAATIAETDASYVSGTVRTTRPLAAGTAQPFGGLGLTLTPAAGSVSPGSTLVARTTGSTLSGVGTSQSIQRYFDIQPAVNTGLDVTMDFSYLTHESNGIPAANMTLFKSATSTSGPWAPQLPGVVSGNTVTKANISDFSLWTLGNSAAPLPVELTAFTATREGQDALLRWNTASERNNKGFEVQVSTEGQTFRTLAFVAGAGSSSSPRAYRFLDQEAGKAGLRYYRLRQLDLNGTASFSPVQTVAFGAPATVSVQALPNPFGSSLSLSLTLPTASPVTVIATDALGRTVRSYDLGLLPAGSSQPTLRDLADLPSGVYVLRVAVAGSLHSLKVIKE